MNGPEHYREAERLMQPQLAYPGAGEPRRAPSESEIAQAQVHATLALAAATIDTSNRRASDADDWSEAIR